LAIGLKERQAIEEDCLRYQSPARYRIDKRLLELATNHVRNAFGSEQYFIRRRVESETAQPRAGIDAFHLFNARDRHAGSGMHGQVERDPVGLRDGGGIERVARKIRHRDFVAFGAQPGGGRSEAEGLMAEIVRGDEENSHPWFHYRGGGTTGLSGCNQPAPPWYNGQVTTAQDEARSELVQTLGEIRQLKDTISSMRDQMEEMRAAEQQKIQQAVVSVNEETIQLRHTVARMREELENARASEQQKTQQAVAASRDEVIQLRATVQALRDEMERQKFGFEDSIQSLQAASRNEIKQLQLTIVDLRGKLETSDADGR